MCDVRQGREGKGGAKDGNLPANRVAMKNDGRRAGDGDDKERKGRGGDDQGGGDDRWTGNACNYSAWVWLTLQRNITVFLFTAQRWPHGVGEVLVACLFLRLCVPGFCRCPSSIAIADHSFTSLIQSLLLTSLVISFPPLVHPSSPQEGGEGGSTLVESERDPSFRVYHYQTTRCWYPDQEVVEALATAPVNPLTVPEPRRVRNKWRQGEQRRERTKKRGLPVNEWRPLPIRERWRQGDRSSL